MLLSMFGWPEHSCLEWVVGFVLRAGVGAVSAPGGYRGRFSVGNQGRLPTANELFALTIVIIAAFSALAFAIVAALDEHPPPRYCPGSWGLPYRSFDR